MKSNETTKKIAHYTIQRNIWGNWIGYVSGRKVYDAGRGIKGLNDAEDWLKRRWAGFVKVGDVVRLRATVQHHTCPEGREDNLTAKVLMVLDKDGGLKMDRDLRGCQYWNASDVEYAE